MSDDPHFTDEEARLRYGANGGNWADVTSERGFERVSEAKHVLLWLTAIALGLGIVLGAAAPRRP